MSKIFKMCVASVIAMSAIPTTHAHAEIATPAIVDFKETDYSEWTPERMMNAEESDDIAYTQEALTTSTPDTKFAKSQDGPVFIVEPTNPTIPTDGVKIEDQAIPITVGKLFSVTPNGKDFVCSASVVNSESRNMLYTAAHCVYTIRTDDGNIEGPHSNLRFIPAYHEVEDPEDPNATTINMPYGEWFIQNTSVFQGWTNDKKRQYDQAFISLEPNSEGQNILDLVGGNGLTHNDERAQGFIDIWGYPTVTTQEYEADTTRPDHCRVFIVPSNEVVPGGVQATCSMTAGSSGGPWIRDMSDPNKGYIIAVTSGRLDETWYDRTKMHGALNNEDTLALYKHREQDSS